MAIVGLWSFSCMTLRIGFDPTQCACAHDMSNRLIEGLCVILLPPRSRIAKLSQPIRRSMPRDSIAELRSRLFVAINGRELQRWSNPKLKWIWFVRVTPTYDKIFFDGINRKYLRIRLRLLKSLAVRMDYAGRLNWVFEWTVFYPNPSVCAFLRNP